MKRIVSTVLGLAVAATLAHAASNEVSSVNVVGYVKQTVDPGGKFYMMAQNFYTMAGSNTLEDIFGTTTLAQSDFLTECDKVTIWQTGPSSYQTYAQWTDGKFYLANDQAEFNAGTAANPSLKLGDAFWFVTASGGTSKDLSLLGEVPADKTNTVNLVTGFQMISYPFSADISLQDTDFVNDGAASSDFLTECDKITVWDGAGYQTYAPWTDGSWYKANDQTEFNAGILATESIKLGMGVWYEAISGYPWTEAIPYEGSL